jgi:hypothetical protein
MAYYSSPAHVAGQGLFRQAMTPARQSPYAGTGYASYPSAPAFYSNVYTTAPVQVAQPVYSVAPAQPMQVAPATSGVAGQFWNPVRIPRLPRSVEEFVRLRNQLSKTPDGAFAMMILAMHLYTVNRTLGTQCLIVSMHRSRLRPAKPNSRAVTYRGMRPWGQMWDDLQRRLQKFPYIPKAYFDGCTTSSGYALPAGPLTVRVKDCLGLKLTSSRQRSRHAISNGAMSSPPVPRGMILEANTRGIWKAFNWESILAPCRAPPVLDDGDDI